MRGQWKTEPVLVGLTVAQLLGVIVATILGWVVLSGTHVRPGWLTANWPSPRVPFATQGLVWIHLLAALPTAWLAARYLPLRRPIDKDTLIPPSVWAGLFVVGAGVWGWVTILSGPAVPGWSSDHTYAELATLRVLWCLVWQGFACAALQALGPAADGTSDNQQSYVAPHPFSVLGVAALVIALTAAWSIPGVYAKSVIRRETRMAARHIQQEQYRLAWGNIQPLVDLASAERIGNSPPDAALEQLRRHLAQLVRVVQVPLPSDADREAILGRARILCQLAYWDDAMALLEPLATNDPRAAWQLVLLHEERGELEQSVAAAEAGWNLLTGDDQPESMRLREEILVKWAHNLRRLRRFEEAEQRLLAAREVLPPENGLVDFELGFHYKEAGFHGRARTFYQRAAEDPRLASRVDAELAALEAEMSYCMPLPGSSSSRQSSDRYLSR